MELATLIEMTANDAALRRRQTLQPVGGKGDKIFPPTYPGEGREDPPRHVYERRRLNDRELSCVLVDSVQSQANRLELCLLAAAEGGSPIPHVVVDFSKAALEGITKVTSLDAPHRIYDAILRDSQLDDTPFMDSEIGRRLVKVKPENASAVLEVSPTALLFGAWHSTGGGGGLMAKFARCLISEIVAIDVPVTESVDRKTNEIVMQTAARRPGSRMDPLGVLRKVEVYKGEGGSWGTSEKAAGKGAKKVRPSEINHGNIAPSIQALGITCDYLEHSFVLSFAALRRLRFGGDPRDAAGRSYLAALGLLALTEQDARGYALRSRCDLVCDGRRPLELVHPDGTTDEIEIDRKAARTLYQHAFDRALEVGCKLPSDPLILKPQPKLVDIVRQSQELALAGAGGEAEAEESP